VTALPHREATLSPWLEASEATPERDAEFVTLSGEEVRPLYTEADLPAPEAIGLPGEYPFTEGKQIDRVTAVRARREGDAVDAALGRLRTVAVGDGNLMPTLVECARVHATEGEIISALQEVWGAYTETPVF